MSWTLWSFWSRESSPTYGAPDVIFWSPNGRHSETYQCNKVGEKNRCSLVEEELRESLEWAFELYGGLLENVAEFRYLGQVLTK